MQSLRSGQHGAQRQLQRVALEARHYRFTVHLLQELEPNQARILLTGSSYWIIIITATHQVPRQLYFKYLHNSGPLAMIVALLLLLW
jgi:hypothetical protein